MTYHPFFCLCLRSGSGLGIVFADLQFAGRHGDEYEIRGGSVDYLKVSGLLNFTDLMTSWSPGYFVLPILEEFEVVS